MIKYKFSKCLYIISLWIISIIKDIWQHSSLLLITVWVNGADFHSYTTNVFAVMRLRFHSGPCSDSSVPGWNTDRTSFSHQVAAGSQGKCAICVVTALNDLCTQEHVQRAEKAQIHIPNHWAPTCWATEKSQPNFMLSEFK